MFFFQLRFPESFFGFTKDMGARSSKSSNTKKGSSNAHGHHVTGIQPHELKQSHFQGDKTPSRMSTHSSTLEKKQTKEPVSTPKTNVSEYSVNEDDFYDGIPRFPMTLSEKSKSRRFRVCKIFTLATFFSSHMMLLG